MLDPTQTHPSPPTVMAVNATGQLMVSASEVPPILCVQNLTLRTPALQLFPSASTSSVILAAFHPERPNLFMLAFRDGALAAYDATQFARRNGTKMDVNSSTLKDDKAGEIGRFYKLHRTTTKAGSESDVISAPADTPGMTSLGITGAVFLPGYRSRAVTAGADGRCRIVDFEGGGQILRTWHAQAPVTSLAVLSGRGHSSPGDPLASANRPKTAKTSSEDFGTLISVGRADGKVVLFDSVGIKIADTVINASGESIIGLEWVTGMTPEKNLDSERLPSNHTIRLRLPSEPGIRISVSQKRPSHVSIVDEEPGVRIAEPVASPAVPVQSLSLQEHDLSKEESQGTVIRSSVPAGNTFDKPPVQFSTNYLDLFSPVKPNNPTTMQQVPALHSSPTHRRPRLTSTLFKPTSYDSEDVSPKTATDPSHSATDDNDVQTNDDPSASQPGKSFTESAPAQKFSISPKKRATTIMITPGHLVTSSSSSNDTTSSSSSAMNASNGQILADLRRVGLAGGNQQGRKSTNKAFFAPYMNCTPGSNIRRKSQGRPSSTRDSITPKASKSINRASGVVSSDSTHEEPPDDIWITESSATEALAKRTLQAKQKTAPVANPPSETRRPTSPQKRTLSSHPAPPPTIITSLKSPLPTRPPPAPPIARFLHTHQPASPTIVNSSDEARYYTAHTCLSPPSAAEATTAIDSAWSPDSEQIRRLCPRGSSLSEGKKKKKRVVLADVETGNGNARVRETGHGQGEVKKEQGKEKEEDVKAMGKVVEGTLRVKPKGLKITVNVEKKVCDGCEECQSDIRSLKDEVARLRAEVLGLRTIVRRAGLH
ncbi:hypothetical protein MBLNU457_4611t1 [Dothideomycetes sp. NU457]